MENKAGLYIPEEILADGQLGSTQKMVYAAMVAAADNDNVCRLSLQELGDRIGITAGAAKVARRKLAEFGYAKRVEYTQRNYKLIPRGNGGKDNG